AAHYRIPVVFVIFNNTSYRILKQRLHALRGHAEQVDAYVGMELTDPAVDFVGLARSLGVAAARAKTVAEATDLIAQGLKSDTSLLIDVELDRAFKPRGFVVIASHRLSPSASPRVNSTKQSRFIRACVAAEIASSRCALLAMTPTYTFEMSKVGAAKSSSTPTRRSASPCSWMYWVSASISRRFSCTPYFQKSAPIAAMVSRVSASRNGKLTISALTSQRFTIAIAFASQNAL